ncbi:MAG TPA: hypothetical protein VEH04_09730 [Verrucomicrobiae bacterium]|nr:hypothetical protein [Verrucomicrobiae bacterium]
MQTHFSFSPGRRALPFAVAAWAAAASVCALELSLGTHSAGAGSVVTMPVTVSGTPTNLSAVAFFVTNSPAWAIPAVIPAPSQPHVQCFVDDFGNGIHRVTAFVLGGSPIANGPLLLLNYSVPANAIPAVYPLILPAVLEPPFSANPEARTLAGNELISSTAQPGSILVLGARPLLIPIGRLANGAFVFRVESEVSTYSVFASTNLAAPIGEWENMGPPSPRGAGAYEFVDSHATNHAARFYLLKP